jgi:arylsulfatase A-like enzyme
LELANIPVSNDIDGLSFLPDLLQSGNLKQHEYLYWEFHEQGGKQAVHWKEWKAIKLKVSADSDTTIELFNLASDPAEQVNVASKFPDIVKKMTDYMKEAHQGSRDWPLLPGEKL